MLRDVPLQAQCLTTALGVVLQRAADLLNMAFAVLSRLSTPLSPW